MSQATVAMVDVDQTGEVAQESRLLEILSRGPCAANLIWIAEHSGFSVAEVETIATRMEAAGVVQIWVSLRKHRCVTLTASTVDRLGLVVVSDQGLGWWGRHEPRKARVGLRRVRAREAALTAYDRLMAGLEDTRTLAPLDEVILHERLGSWQAALPQNDPDRRLSWPPVRLGCRPWRFREGGRMWPAREGEASPDPDFCPTCHGESKRKRGLLCLTCLPHRGGPPPAAPGKGRKSGLRGGTGR